MIIKFRKFMEKDIPYRVKWFNNTKVNNFVGEIGGKTTLDKEKKFFEKSRKDKNRADFIIYENKKPIGLLSLTNINKDDKNAEFIVVIGDDNYRGKGIGKMATKWIIDYGFNKLKLHKIKLSVTADNKIAINLYKSLGFLVEGELKDEIITKGKFRNFILMAIFNK